LARDCSGYSEGAAGRILYSRVVRKFGCGELFVPRRHTTSGIIPTAGARTSRRRSL